jgi:hypothetical protein
MATAITTTPQDITGDFDLVSIPSGSPAGNAALQKSLGATSTAWQLLETVQPGQHLFVKNTGTNSFRLAENAANVTIEFSQ